MGAGILVARDASLVSWGVSHVLAEGNRITDVQTTSPAYTLAGWDPAQPLTGHVAVEIHAFACDDERAFAVLLQASAVENVRIASTTISRAGGAGVL